MLGLALLGALTLYYPIEPPRRPRGVSAALGQQTESAGELVPSLVPLKSKEQPGLYHAPVLRESQLCILELEYSVMCILQMTKSGHREVQEVAPGHTAKPASSRAGV